MSAAASEPTLAFEDTSLAPGDLFATRYEVLGVLGEGGMGAVYRVLDRELDEEVALKVLRPEIARRSDALERFRREVKLARRVTHPNVARTYDLGASGEHRYLTMELIEGASLARRVGAKPMPLADTLRIAADICRGLCAAHSVGVVHRDLKPDNVLLAGDRGEGPLAPEVRVVITDFGIARLSETRGTTVQTPNPTGPARTSPGSTQGQRPLTVGMVIGTPAYMAPEQVLGQDLDGRADVFALGVLLFELLTGKLPFEGESPYATAAARLGRTAPDLREVDGSIPDAVATLVADALSQRRDDRPDAQRMLQTLDALRGVGPSNLDSLDRSTLSSTAAIGPGLEALTLAHSSRARSVAVLALNAPPEGPDRALANDLSATLADALSKLRALRVVPPSVCSIELASHLRRPTEGEPAALDHAALAQALRVDRLLTGTFRAEGARVRVNLRVLDPSVGTQTWAERFEGTRDGLFAFEDSLTRAATDALRTMIAASDDGHSSGPADPAVRALYDKARSAMSRFLDTPAQEEAVSLLRRAHELAPDDGYVLSALGAALLRVTLARRENAESIREAEDFALRALSADPSIGETYATVGLIRLHQGQLRNAARAFREALARNPRHAEASSYLGRLLCESGNVRDGVRRLEYAVRLDPSMQRAYWDLARTYALEGDRARALEAVAQAQSGQKLLTAVPLMARLAVWWRDRDLARDALERLENSGVAPGTFPRTGFEPLLRAFVEDRPMRPEEDTWITAAPNVVSLSNRAFIYQVSAEVRAYAGDRDGALASLEAAADLPLVDVLWLDRCPMLEPLRDSPRYGRVRARVAARAAEMLST